MSRGKSIHIGLNVVDANAYGGWDGQLSGCVNDANGLQSLANSLGYQSTILTNFQATSTRVLQEISNAARELQSGDILLLTYSGHGGQVSDVNGDETDSMDETWVLYDRELVDDELYSLWSQFADGVRIIVLSDSCHSGTVAKAMLTSDILAARQARREREKPGETTRPFEKQWEDTPRAMPRSVQERVNQLGRTMYNQVQWIAGPSRDAQIAASIILISGCQDNQLSYDGSFYGRFTETLLQIWDNGAFQGDYRSFHRAIVNRMPPEQTPNFFTTGRSNSAYEQQRPFTIQSPGGQSTGGGIQPESSRPTLRYGASGEDVRYLQERLRDRGYSITVDGFFGSMTRSSVEEFQAAQNLVVDGIVGPRTWAALEGNPGSSSTPTEPIPGTPGHSGRPTLRQGDRGNDVRYLQELLIMQGYYLTVDSIFGPMTESRVRDFQRSVSLTMDGVVGPQTWAALES